MKPTTAFSLIAVAYATVVLAIPTPSHPPALSDVITVEDTHLSGAPELAHGDHRGHEEAAAEHLDKRLLYGPKKFWPGLNGIKRETDEEADSTNLERRLLYGPKKFWPGLNGIKRDVSQDDQVDAEADGEDLEKRLLYGPKKFWPGLNGI